MEKNVLGFWIKVPCSHNIGSCVYQDVCKYLADACPFLQLYGIPCICPIPANTYTIPDTTLEATQSLPSDAPGSYRVYANLLSGSAGQLGCLYFEISIAG
jgi:ganglioside GM2 activator